MAWSTCACGEAVNRVDGTGGKPAGTTVAVSGLPRNSLVEIEVTALAA
jgi:enamine deaminase RidA (YjgF/YER057c/UK114 family)